MRSRNCRRVGTDDFDLAERGGVEQADASPVSWRILVRRRRAIVFAAHRKTPGAFSMGPTSLERGAVLGRPSRGMGVRRMGSKRSPRAGPAKAPKVMGVYGGRKVVRPTSGIGFLSSGGGDAKRIHVRKLALVGRHGRSSCSA